MPENSSFGPESFSKRAVLAASQGEGSSSALARGFNSNIASSVASESSIDIDNPDPEIVKVVGRHLVKSEAATGESAGQGSETNVDEPSAGASATGGGAASGGTPGGADLEDNFASLRLQGGDITRQLYNWQREHEEGTKRGRSRSFDHLPRPPAVVGVNGNATMDARNIRAPGGFRRNFIVQRSLQEEADGRPPTFLTRNFIEFLSIYGHFAGEELEEEESGAEEEEEEDEQRALTEGRGTTERAPLLGRPRLARKPSAHGQGKATATKAVLLLLKSFVGTGVLFLPKAYSNGGMLFCSVVLVCVSLISYWCFLLLIASKDAVGVNSFGDIGDALYGPGMRRLILISIVISQIGFAAAYIVFVSENLQAFVVAVAGKTIGLEAFIALQLLIFLPLSMVRDIAKLSGTALIADFFILLGLVYLYYSGMFQVVRDGVADIVLFNRQDWTLFIGTAIFTYEGIGLIIPIQESMRKPAQFGPVLFGVMVGITLVFVSMGALQYAAYGTEVKTVIISNLPQDSKFVNAVQFLYSAAILLSTPLQLFPAIRITENWLFVRSGKFSSKVKWQKNTFRAALTLFTAVVAWVGSDDLDRFVALTGSFACIPLVYIYPPLLHLKAYPNQHWALHMSDYLLFFLGLCAMTYTTSETVRSWIAHP